MLSGWQLVGWLAGLFQLCLYHIFIHGKEVQIRQGYSLGNVVVQWYGETFDLGSARMFTTGIFETYFFCYKASYLVVLPPLTAVLLLNLIDFTAS